MPLIKHSRVVDDPWIPVADDGPLPAAGPVLVSLARWRSDRDALIGRGEPLGVRLASHETAPEIAADLPHLALVAITFPTYRDGRGYTTARLLRQRHRFQGELRAVGNVLRDQFLFLQRCGFDAYDVAKDADVAAWRAAIEEMSVWYQPAADHRVPAVRRRHLREAAE
ncbi:MAG: DUF934 domain-containing protein [Rhodospirillales bacterium]|nr:DUF934 domain-containing protein [Rhodospirillales bacterium]